MNPLHRLKRLLKSNRSNWNIKARQLIDEVDKYELGVDYQNIEKVEYWLDKKYEDIYYVQVNDIPVGPPLPNKEDARTVANWLHTNRKIFSLVKHAPKHTND